MIRLTGKTIWDGTASGTAYVFRKPSSSREKTGAVCAADEMRRLKSAICAVKESLETCITQAETEAARGIFEVHRMMLEDEDVLSALYDAVENGGMSAEGAAEETKRRFVRLFLDTRDEGMMARADDVRDVFGRMKAFLSEEDMQEVPHEPFVLAADELLPGDLMLFRRENLAGIVMGSGSTYSHVSILIREMGIPAVICADLNGVETGMRVLMDGSEVCFEPDGEAEAAFESARRLRAGRKTGALLRSLPCALFGNIGTAQETALLDICDGIGLFRTEFLFMDRPDLPGEEEQFQTYKSVLCAAKGKPVTIRTFDLGADKQASALPLTPESNPALGCRGLRVYSLYPEAFQTQLRALLRAAVCGEMRMMVPMVTSPGEITEIRRQVQAAAEALSSQGVAYRIPPLGAMIETPAAVMMSEELAACVDFFSIGTNDLMQYTYAIDRQNAQAETLTGERPAALLRLIEIAVRNAHEAGIRIGICGEMASDPYLIPEWIKMGIDSLSVAPAVLK